MLGKTAIFLAVLLFCSTCFGAEIENAIMVESVRASIVLEGSGEVSGRLQNKEVEIEVLSLRETESQHILSLNETLEINGKTVLPETSRDEWGNNYALFKVSETGKFYYRIEALIETQAVFPNLQEIDLGNGIEQFEKFTQSSQNIESNSEAIRTVALNRFDSNSWIDTIVEVTQWTYNSMEYDLAYFPETYSALETLGTKKGVCDEYSVLAAAMLRAKGIPTRFVTGLTYSPKVEKGWDNHAWLEVYSPKSGWVALDPTFGEAGTVDGTHIIRGFFQDPADSSVSKARAVQTATVSFEENTVEIDLKSVREFGAVFSIEAGKEVMPANKWHDLDIEAKNGLGKAVIGWFSLVLPKGFEAGEKKKILFFEEGEEKLLEWKIRVDSELEEGEYLSGQYKIVGIGFDLENELKVLPGSGFVEEAEVKLLDVLAIAEGNSLVVEISLENIGAEKAVVEIEIDGNAQQIEVPGFESLTARIPLPKEENKNYEVSIRGPGLEYQTTVTMHEGKPLPVQEALPTGQQQAANLVQGIAGQLFSFEAAMLAAIIIGLGVIGLLLKALLSK